MLDPWAGALPFEDVDEVDHCQRLVDPPQDFDDLHLDGVEETRRQGAPEVPVPPVLVVDGHANRLGRAKWPDYCMFCH